MRHKECYCSLNSLSKNYIDEFCNRCDIDIDAPAIEEREADEAGNTIWGLYLYLLEAVGRTRE